MVTTIRFAFFVLTGFEGEGVAVQLKTGVFQDEKRGFSPKTGILGWKMSDVASDANQVFEVKKGGFSWEPIFSAMRCNFIWNPHVWNGKRGLSHCSTSISTWDQTIIAIISNRI